MLSCFKKDNLEYLYFNSAFTNKITFPSISGGPSTANRGLG